MQKKTKQVENKCEMRTVTSSDVNSLRHANVLSFSPSFRTYLQNISLCVRVRERGGERGREREREGERGRGKERKKDRKNRLEGGRRRLKNTVVFLHSTHEVHPRRFAITLMISLIRSHLSFARFSINNIKSQNKSLIYFFKNYKY